MASMRYLSIFYHIQMGLIAKQWIDMQQCQITYKLPIMPVVLRFSCVHVVGGHHDFVHIEEVSDKVKAAVEPLKAQAEEKFDEIAALVKEVTISISHWDIDTDCGVRLIQSTRDEQVTNQNLGTSKLTGYKIKFIDITFRNRTVAEHEKKSIKCHALSLYPQHPHHLRTFRTVMIFLEIIGYVIERR